MFLGESDGGIWENILSIIGSNAESVLPHHRQDLIGEISIDGICLVTDRYNCSLLDTGVQCGLVKRLLLC